MRSSRRGLISFCAMTGPPLVSSTSLPTTVPCRSKDTLDISSGNRVCAGQEAVSLAAGWLAGQPGLGEGRGERGHQAEHVQRTVLASVESRRHQIFGASGGSLRLSSAGSRILVGSPPISL